MTSVSRARVSGSEAVLGSSTLSPPTWPVVLAVSRARNEASMPVSCCISVPPRGPQRVPGVILPSLRSGTVTSSAAAGPRHPTWPLPEGGTSLFLRSRRLLRRPRQGADTHLIYVSLTRIAHTLAGGRG